MLERAQPRHLPQSSDDRARRLEASVLSGLQTHLMAPDLVKEFAAEYHRELNRLNAAREEDFGRKREELDRVERQLHEHYRRDRGGIFRTPSMKDELLALEARKLDLLAELKHAPAPAPRLHPNLAELYRQKVERLHQELNRPELRTEAARALRDLIDEVRLVPENGRLEIELFGELAGILALARTARSPSRRGRDGLRVNRWLRGEDLNL